MLKDDHYCERSETSLTTLDVYKKVLRWMTPVQLEADVAIKMCT